MRYLIEHETVLEYPHTVREHHIELRLSPRSDGHQKVLSSVIETDPPSELSTYHDYFGNRADYFCVIPPHRTLITRLRSEVETLKENPFSFDPVPPAEEREWLNKELGANPALYDFILHRSLLTPAIDKLAEVIETAIPKRDGTRPMLESLLELQAWVSSQLEYRPGSTEVHGSLVTSVRQGGGSVRSLPIFLSPWCVPGISRPVTSWGTLTPVSAAPWRLRWPPTPGPRCWCRERGGSALTPPTTFWQTTIMWRWPSVGIPTMPLPNGEVSRGIRPENSRKLRSPCRRFPDFHLY